MAIRQAAEAAAQSLEPDPSAERATRRTVHRLQLGATLHILREQDTLRLSSKMSVRMHGAKERGAGG